MFRSPWTIHYQWVITTGLRAPDGVEKRVYLINGDTAIFCCEHVLMSTDAFPGPTIEARSGDTIVVEVANKLCDDEGVSIHWHGLHMTGKFGKNQINDLQSEVFKCDGKQGRTRWMGLLASPNAQYPRTETLPTNSILMLIKPELIGIVSQSKFLSK